MHHSAEDLLVGPAVWDQLDASRPVAVLLAAVLHELDHEECRKLSLTLADVLATGSRLVVSHLVCAGGRTGGPAARLWREQVGPVRSRTVAQLVDVLPGWIWDVGPVPADRWRRMPGRRQSSGVIAGTATLTA